MSVAGRIVVLALLCMSQVFEAMVAWIKHDKPARLEYMPKLMEHVRLPLLSRDYLVQVMCFSTTLSQM